MGLLVLRRCNEDVHARYYDSLEDMSAPNCSAAETVMQMVFEDMGKAAPLLRKVNKAIQHNATDCGVFVLHWWELEVRKFRGEGIPMQYPWTSNAIKDRKKRLVSFVAQVGKAKEQIAKGGISFAKTPIPDVAKGQKEDVEYCALQKTDVQMMKMSDLAKKATDQGSIYCLRMFKMQMVARWVH